MNLRGKVYPLLKISEKLNLKEKVSLGSSQIAIIVNCKKQDYAVVVDDILRQQQVVIKKISDEVKQTKGLMGSTILGNGKPALILDLLQLFQVNEKVKSSTGPNQAVAPTLKTGSLVA
jgi:two-component system chemotaxis sensor kinase CheA